MPAILIIEDDTAFSKLLARFLERHGYSVELAKDVQTGKTLLQKKVFDLLLLDYRLPDGLGIDILHFINEGGLKVQAIIMTSFHDIKTAVTTIRLGAKDYITKPVNPDELLLVVQAVAANKETLTQPAPPPPLFITGHGAAAKKLQEHIRLVAPTDFSVIIQGDNGTGKEQVARSIHEQSTRSHKPFVALDCGALSPALAGGELFGYVKGAFTGALQNKQGQFEEANGGTIFLDEVGNLDYEIQVKLLRAVQERIIQPLGSNHQVKVDVRIICATNDNLINAVRNGKFREDLYHRLNEFTIYVPALHERMEDIDEFISHFIAQTNAELGKQVKGISPAVRDLFLRYEWPGNLRQLNNIIRRSVLLAEVEEITTASLPEEMLQSVQQSAAPQAPDLKATREHTERDLIVKTLEETHYNKSKAAKLLNIDRTTLYYKMIKYNISSN